MYCKKCGNKIENNIKYCSFCGKKNNTSNEKKLKFINRKNLIIMFSLIIIVFMSLLIENIGTKCKYGNCSNKRTNDSDYCFSHTCIELYCNNSVSYNSTFCFYHKTENEKEEKEKNSGFNNYLKTNNVTLSAKEVQYNMQNNLNKDFSLIGQATLDDYYNYGFNDDIEGSYFCINVNPSENGYSDNWYIYCHRDSFEKLYNQLLKGSVKVRMVCEIPSYRYKEGQGNMAEANYISWGN